MKTMNKVMLLGRVGQEPAIRRAGEAEVVRLSLATDRSVKRGDEWDTVADWHQVECWERLAHQVVDRVHKGDVVAVVGELRQNSWVDQEGQRRTRIVVRAYEISPLGRRARGEAKPSVSSVDEVRLKAAHIPDQAEVPF